MVQRPAGGVQFRVPSALIFDVKSTTSAFATASCALTEGVATEFRSRTVANAALSSKRCTRGTESQRNSAILYSVDGGGASVFTTTSNSRRGGAGGGVTKLTRKTRAVTGGNDKVCSPAP